MRRIYTPNTYSELFDKPFDGEGDRVIDRSVEAYAIKTVSSGPRLDVEAFPVWATNGDRREAKESSTPEARRRVNERNSKKRFLRLFYANFGQGDMFLTLTIEGEVSAQIAKRQVTNYIPRLKRLRKKQGLPELKYLYYIQGGNVGKTGNPVRWHVHMFINAMDRAAAEGAWKAGFANSKVLRKRGDKLVGIGSYATRFYKSERIECEELLLRRWAASSNLSKPKVRYPKHRLTRRRASKIAEDYQGAARIFEKEFPQYELYELEIRQSDFVGGAYFYATLFRRE